MNSYHYPSGSRGSRTRFHSTTSYEPFRSVLYSRPFTELELSKPSQLICDQSLNSSVDSIQLYENPFTSYASFSMYESRPATQPLKENPFLKATPFRFNQKEPAKENVKGLSAWEKQKYLQIYAESKEREYDRPLDELQRYDTPTETLVDQGVTRSKKTPPSKTQKIEELVMEGQPKTATFKKKNTINIEQQVGFDKGSPLNLKSKFTQLESIPKQVPVAWKQVKEQNDRPQDEEEGSNKSQNSLIHKLIKAPQSKPPNNLNMTNSKVFEYNSGGEQNNPYAPVQTQERAKLERQVEHIIRPRDQETFNFEAKQERQSPRMQGTYMNKAKEFPPSITYKYNKYEMIKVI